MKEQSSNESNKDSILSLSGSLDLDGYEIEDEVAQLQSEPKKVYKTQEQIDD